MDILEIKKALLSCIKKKDDFFFCPCECGKKSRSRSVILQHLSRIKTCKNKKKNIEPDIIPIETKEEIKEIKKEEKEKKKIIITFN